MANAMAQAIGAQAAFPGRQVISLSGDGGFTMLMGDFLSLAQLDLPVKVVVFNNGALGFIELEQKSTGFLAFRHRAQQSEFRGDGRSRRHPRHSARRPGRGRATALPLPSRMTGPSSIDAVVNRTELAMPPSITVEMAKGFSLYMVKAS